MHRQPSEHQAITNSNILTKWRLNLEKVLSQTRYKIQSRSQPLVPAVHKTRLFELLLVWYPMDFFSAKAARRPNAISVFSWGTGSWWWLLPACTHTRWTCSGVKVSGRWYNAKRPHPLEQTEILICCRALGLDDQRYTVYCVLQFPMLLTCVRHSLRYYVSWLRVARQNEPPSVVGKSLQCT